VLLLIFAGALGEETGWRGYALPQLQRRFSPLASSLILAGLWFGWHLPQFLVIATYRDFAPAGYVGMFLGLACGAVVLTWLYNRSGGSILLVAVWHGLYNVVSGTQAATGLLAAVVSTVIMIQGVVLIVLEVRARRRGRPSVLGRREPSSAAQHLGHQPSGQPGPTAAAARPGRTPAGPTPDAPPLPWPLHRPHL
jgi:CAAX protease family protein